MEHQILVTSAKNEVAWYRQSLRFLGLKEHDDGYRGTFLRKRRVDRVRTFCKKHHLHFAYDNAYGKRNGTYRQAYFTHNPSIKRGKYRCVYCGRLLPKSKTVVDHLYPIGAVSKSAKLQTRLQKEGISSINAPKNLVSSCARCNARKGQKMGIWIRRGKRGRKPLYWPIRKGIRAACIVLLLAGIAAIGYLAIKDPTKLTNFSHTLIRSIEGGIHGRYHI